MKVTLTVEFEVEPDHDLNGKEEANVNGMLRRVARNRLAALVGRRLGGEVQSVGWEVTVADLDVTGTSKVN